MPFRRAILATEATCAKPATAAARLVPFAPRYAETVLSWVRDEREAYWLAPKSTPPLTAGELRAWQVPGHQQFLLLPEADGDPVGYGELNLLNANRDRYWLGHLIVDSRQRGRGYGRELTRLLLERAFRVHRARAVTLVVFPENTTAIRCYLATGMFPDGHETHEFPSYGTCVTLLRMAAYRPF